MNRCDRCQEEVFFIKQTPFNDPEGSVKHHCRIKIRLPITMNEHEIIKANYKLNIRIIQSLENMQKEIEELGRKMERHNAN